MASEAKTRKRRRPYRPSIKEVEKATGKKVAAVTYGADGSRTYTFNEPRNNPNGTPIESPDELRKLI
jgi:hypothetical protein